MRGPGEDGPDDRGGGVRGEMHSINQEKFSTIQNFSFIIVNLATATLTRQSTDGHLVEADKLTINYYQLIEIFGWKSGLICPAFQSNKIISREIIKTIVLKLRIIAIIILLVFSHN